MPKIFETFDDIHTVNNNGSEKLGQGSFSKVKLVCHRSDPDKWYAMKEIAIHNEKDRNLVFKEINLHMTLEHPNIIHFEDYIETPEIVYIFLEYAPNGDLFGYMNKQKPNDKSLLKIFYQTCTAIEYIHSKNIMHRDLKPENILLDENNNAKICDFGWSAEYFEDVKRETLCGTFEYMAPEVFFRNQQTKKTDIWSLGILLYELYHGYAPFRGIRMDTVMYAIMRNVVAFKKSVPSDVKDLIVKILIFDQKKRPSIEEILEHQLIANFIKEKDDHSTDKENIDRVSKISNNEATDKEAKHMATTNNYHNTIANTSETEMPPKNFVKQPSTHYNTPNTNYNSAYKPSDYSNYFKKKTRTEDCSSFKSFNSVDKIASSTKNDVKRYKASFTQAKPGYSSHNLYFAKSTKLNSSFSSNIPSNVKIRSQRTIVNPFSTNVDCSGFNTYAKADVGNHAIKNAYNSPASAHKYNFVKKSTFQEGEKNRIGQFNMPARQ